MVDTSTPPEPDKVANDAIDAVDAFTAKMVAFDSDLKIADKKTLDTLISFVGAQEFNSIISCGIAHLMSETLMHSMMPSPNAR